ncbi:rhodanese-like domain-containing protein [Candidatus Pacearchaeota archaeon]|nr:rhodanese-like domain-containing protein [Candidatus Pacearchaeota archaeon]
METTKILVLALITGILAGSISGYFFSNQEDSEEEMIKEFYLQQNAVYASPHSLRLKMDKGSEDYVLVDLRSAEEYEKEHIIGAISIPAYKDKKTSAYDDVDRIVGEFSKLSKDKEVIVYCYSTPCMSGRKIGKLLAENDIYVKHLGIGWNEWRYFWNLWNHEYEWNETDVLDYVSIGKEPGIPKIKENTGVCTVEGGC